MLTLSIATTLSLALAGDIRWSASFDEALAQAEEEAKVVFVAVHMPGERANERMAREVYTDKVITELATRTVNLIAVSIPDYRQHGTRVKLGSLAEQELAQLDADIRERVLRPDADGFVAAPQHVFLRPDGEVILSVPYVVTAGELEWCFVAALGALDPEQAPKASGRAKPPKRLLKGAVLAGTEKSIGASPADLEEVRELIDRIRRGERGGRRAALLRIATADEEEAREFVSEEMRGGGRRGDEWRVALIRGIQRRSPPSWWEVVEEFKTSSNAEVREEVAACLEVFGAPESAKAIKVALGKEKDPRLKGMWLRAWASAAPGDSGARRSILRAAKGAKAELERANAALALGYLQRGDDVDGLLETLIADEEAPKQVRVAAVAGAAATREDRWGALLQPLVEQAGPLARVASAGLEVLARGRLIPLGRYVSEACGDAVPRERLFGSAR